MQLFCLSLWCTASISDEDYIRHSQNICSEFSLFISLLFSHSTTFQSHFHVSTREIITNYKNRLFSVICLLLVETEKLFPSAKNINISSVELPKISDLRRCVKSMDIFSERDWNKNSAIVLFIECWVDTKNEFEIMLLEGPRIWTCWNGTNVKAPKISFHLDSWQLAYFVLFKDMRRHFSSELEGSKPQSTFIISSSLPFQTL